MSETVTLPAQIDNLIRSMNDKNQSYTIRANYRASLDLIAVEINKAIAKFDKDSYKR